MLSPCLLLTRMNYRLSRTEYKYWYCCKQSYRSHQPSISFIYYYYDIKAKSYHYNNVHILDYNFFIFIQHNTTHFAIIMYIFHHQSVNDDIIKLMLVSNISIMYCTMFFYDRKVQSHIKLIITVVVLCGYMPVPY